MAIELVFKALGDPARVRILQMLSENGEMCVCDITDELGMSQSSVSHHLATLKYSDLVFARREGQWIHYSLNQDTLDAAKTFLVDALRKLEAAPKGKRVCGPDGRGCRSPRVTAARSDDKVVVG